MPDPVALIEVARRLASGITSEDQRRAVSTAYYALFHCLARHAADRFVGAGDTSAPYALIYRSLDHTRVRSVLSEVAKSNLKASYRKALRRFAVSPELREFADVFIPIQDLRQRADYDPFLPSLSQSVVSDRVDEAARALRDFATLDPIERTDVLALMIAGART